MDVITSIGQAISMTKRLREISKNIENAEISNLLADLSLELADTKMSLVDLKEENTSLKTKLAMQIEVDKSDLKYINNVYISEKEDCAYCPLCLDDKNKRIRLTSQPPALRKLGKFRCSNCENWY